MSRLEGKGVIITGATGGIGRATASRFAQEGANLMLIDVNKEKLVELKSQIETKYKRIETQTLALDISAEESWGAIYNKFFEDFDKVDVLVNNAGIGGQEGLLETSMERWESFININLRSVFLGMQRFIPSMIESGGGSIINISSIFALIGSGKNAAYHASKGGINGLTKTTAVEFAKHRIRVNTIHPGVIKTPMTERKLQDEAIYKQYKSLTPWPEFGEPLDIANGALFLASDESAFVTGTELVIDGGYTSQ
ncbi:SDR family NAD(P)-dependent oxidoreductase [Halalkalibacter alkaliphilus]|uniref:SDR family oxidoreductase n=1 Tax=Halalkalibacter alkaliphilus TaxID=2917993 RepID=A0A9X2CWG0_9BACI|nr:glucose 1-dehydrogenase [Halalkalibacter alkaliphilus]MCL7749606.1 SDR family oxidoreductase [Halalkalibacter alkaliphilus]